MPTNFRALRTSVPGRVPTAETFNTAPPEAAMFAVNVADGKLYIPLGDKLMVFSGGVVIDTPLPQMSKPPSLWKRLFG